MAITTKTASDIVYGPDHALHPVIRGSMLRHARIIRDTTDGTFSEYHRRWARQVLGGNDSSYTAILRELSLRQAVQDLYNGGGPYDETQAGAVRANLAAILDSAIAAQLG